MTSTFDYCVVGAGLAGISLAHQLSEKNATVCIIDPKGIAGGASGTPLGLVNPATGRYASLTWRAKECYDSILENLKMVQEETSTIFYKKTGVLRPALDKKIASRMKDNFSSMNWPKNWIEWMDENELNSFNPEVKCVDGGVWLPIGLTVDITKYLEVFVSLLKSKGIETVLNEDYKLEELENSWEIAFDSNSKIVAKNIVFASGAEIKNQSFWPFLQTFPVKGQVAIIKSNSILDFSHAISALGYIASLDRRHIVIGSTYEHSFDHEQTDEQGLDYLLSRLDKVLPTLLESSTVIRQWSGVRASTPNRMPILGTHPGLKNCFLFTGLASKGLLYSSYLAKQMSEFLIKNTSLPTEVDINRFNFRK